MRKKLGSLAPVTFLSLIPTLLIWVIFFARLPIIWNIPLPTDGLATIAANYDGPLYLVVARTLYNNQMIKELFSFSLPVEYYAAHFPLFPLLIRLLAFATNYIYAMLLVTLITSIFCFYYFYLFIGQYVKKQEALWILLVFSVFPARWLIVRSVGSPEPLFIGAIIASIYYFQNKKYWLSGIFGALAQLTKSPGILLFVAYGVYLTYDHFGELATMRFSKWIKKLNYRSYPIMLIPLSLVGLFVAYNYVFGNFFAYFNSGDNIHIFFPPFQVFNYSAPWVDTHWLEEIIFVYLISAFGLVRLMRQKHKLVASFVGVFFLSVIFVSHRDIMRYSLPIIPFLYLAYKDIIVSKEFKYVMALLIIPVFLFSLAFISNNVMPISDWSPFL